MLKNFIYNLIKLVLPADQNAKIKFFYKYINAKINRIIGRSFIPDPRNSIHIETTSHCNLDCVFCAYGKKTSPKLHVSFDHFKKRVLEAVDAGYKGVDLTPITGDVFMDKKFIEKLHFLEHCDNLEFFTFYTNAVLFDEKKIKEIFSFKKLGYCRLSIYGHDLDSFSKIARGNKNQYKLLINNLNSLLKFDKSFFDGRININFKSYYDFNINNFEKNNKYQNPEIAILTKKLAKKLDITLNKPYTLNNWGGLISNKPEDLNYANLKITDSKVPKSGACNLIFSDLQIMADGTVNACACRDVDATLRIGNVNEQKLKDIVSTKNKNYKELIDNQQEGKFNDICRSCDYYRSIYVKRKYSQQTKFKNYNKIEDFLKNY